MAVNLPSVAFTADKRKRATRSSGLGALLVGGSAMENGSRPLARQKPRQYVDSASFVS